MDIWHNIYKKNNSIISRQIADEHLKIPVTGADADIQKIYAFNNIAEYIWQLLDGQATLQEILTSVLSKFDVSDERAKSDITAFIEKALNNNLITIVRE